MEIELNGEKLDFTLEKEQNLLDIIEGIEKWLKDASLIITDLHIGDKDLYHEPRPNWASYPLETIEKISLSALPLQDVLVNSINAVKEYLIILQKAIRDSDTAMMEQLKTGYPYMLESIRQLYINYTTLNLKNELNSYLDFFNSFNIIILKNSSADEKNKILSITGTLLGKLDDILEVELNPLGYLLKINNALKKTAEEIREVSIHLQTGKDRSAMDSIIYFSDQMQQLLYLFRKLKNSDDIDFSRENIAGQSIETFYNEFNTVLKDLVEAFAVKDYVLIGDLLEYEVAPRLDSVIEFIEEINKIREKNGI